MRQKCHFDWPAELDEPGGLFLNQRKELLMAKMMRLHKHGLLGSDTLTDEAADAYAVLIDTQVRELSDFIDSTLKSVAAIHKDRGLNNKGTTDRLWELGVASRNKLHALAQRRRAKLDVDMAKGEKEIPDQLTLPSGSELFRLQRSIEYAEVRRLLAVLPKTERAAEIQSAAERGDRDLLLALQLAQPWVRSRLIDPDVFDTAKARLLEVSEPEAYAKMATMREALSTFRSNNARTKQLIAQATGTPVRDEILELATA